MVIRMAGLLNEDLCCYLHHLHCKLEDIWRESVVSVRVCFLFTFAYNQRTVRRLNMSFPIPGKSLTVLPSTVRECRCRVARILNVWIVLKFNGEFPHSSSVGFTQTAQATGLHALEIRIFKNKQFNAVLYLHLHSLTIYSSSNEYLFAQ